MSVLTIISMTHLPQCPESWSTWDPQKRRIPPTHFVLSNGSVCIFTHRLPTLIPRHFPKLLLAENYRNLCSWAPLSPDSTLSHKWRWKPWVIFLHQGPHRGTIQTIPGSSVSGVQRRTLVSEWTSVEVIMLCVSPTVRGSTHFKHRYGTYKRLSNCSWCEGALNRAQMWAKRNSKHKTNDLRAGHRYKSECWSNWFWLGKPRRYLQGNLSVWDKSRIIKRISIVRKISDC